VVNRVAPQACNFAFDLKTEIGRHLKCFVVVVCKVSALANGTGFINENRVPIKFS